jgi:hypothetical protein
MAFEVYSGPTQYEPFKLDADTDAITVGMAITTTGATSGYVQNVDGSGDAMVGVAVDRASSPAADGDFSVLVSIGSDTVYKTIPDAGTVSQSLVWKTMDVGADGLSVNIDASVTDDLLCVAVDIPQNVLFVKILGTFGAV